MSETRSPRDRLRAIRAGRVSQLLTSEPTDGLPPTEPPRLKLNGKPVTTGAAFDAVIARAHDQTIQNALNSNLAKPVVRSTKQRPTYPIGGGTVSSLAAQMYQAAFKAITNPLIAATLPLAAGGLGAAMAQQREVQRILREVPDELKDLGHLLRLPPSNDNESSAAFMPTDVDTSQAPFPANPPHVPNDFIGPLLDDPDMNELGRTPPYPATPPRLPENQPEDPEQFNRPTIESIPIIEIDWRYLILYHNSSEETEQDTTFVINTMKKLLIEFGFTPAENWGGRERENYFPGPEGGRKGSRYADAAVGVRIGDELYIFNKNTVDVLKDGTPTLRERAAGTDINEKILRTQQMYAPLLQMIPKSRGMPRGEWEVRTEGDLRQFLQIWVDSLNK